MYVRTTTYVCIRRSILIASHVGGACRVHKRKIYISILLPNSVNLCQVTAFGTTEQETAATSTRR